MGGGHACFQPHSNSEDSSSQQWRTQPKIPTVLRVRKLHVLWQSINSHFALGHLRSTFSAQTQPMLTSRTSELTTPSPWKPPPSDLHGASLLHNSGPGSYDLPPETPSVTLSSKKGPSRAFGCSFNSSFLNPQHTYVHSSPVYSPTKMSAQPVHRPPLLYSPISIASNGTELLTICCQNSLLSKTTCWTITKSTKLFIVLEKLQLNCASVPGLQPTSSHSSERFSFLFTPLRIQFNVTGTQLCLLPYIYWVFVMCKELFWA